MDELDIQATVLRAHELAQRNWEADAAQLPVFAGKDRETERKEALIAALDEMDAAKRARDAAAAAERAKAEALEQLAAFATRKVDLAAELAAIEAEEARLNEIANPPAGKKGKRE